MFKKIKSMLHILFVTTILSVLPSVASSNSDSRVPNTPTKLVLKALSDSEVKLQWKDNSDNEQAFEIYQNGEFLYVLDENSTSKIISNLQRGTTYTFKVIAANEVGKSYATQSTITTDYIVKKAPKKRKINMVKIKPQNIKKVVPLKPLLSVTSIDDKDEHENEDIPIKRVYHKRVSQLDKKVCDYRAIEDDSSFIDIFPPHGISWSGQDFSSVVEIEEAFNHARSFDKTTSKYLKMPLQTTWDEWNFQQKALYIINSEREARGIKPFEGVSSSVVEIAQYYADFLQQIGNIAHYEGGNIPKLSFSSSNQKDFYGLIEDVHKDIMDDNEAVIKAVYNWIYIDNENWKNRKFLFTTNLNDNSVLKNREGLLGIGISNGSYQIVTMNAFDPSSSFDDSNIIKVDTTKSAICLLKK